jgi:hypothetical protein
MRRALCACSVLALVCYSVVVPLPPAASNPRLRTARARVRSTGRSDETEAGKEHRAASPVPTARLGRWVTTVVWRGTGKQSFALLGTSAGFGLVSGRSFLVD